MAIVFDCPHCKFPYKLKDELAGKKATCKNPDCRQQITIPVPPSAAELEAAALSALADEVKAEEKAPAAQVIAVHCNQCDHRWTVPREKAGKIVLCPECKHRIKVPEPKDNQPDDWRQKKTKLPSLAKENVEQPKDVVTSADAKQVSGKALIEADAAGIEYEPIPLKRKLMFAGMAAALLGVVAFGIWYMMARSKSRGEDQLMAEAGKEFEGVVKDLPPNEAKLYAAIFHAAEAEYALRQNDPKKLTDAHNAFGKALKEMRDLKDGGGPERNAVAAELAMTLLEFGGTDDEVKAQTRYRWVPANDANIRPAERPRTMLEELPKALGLIHGTGADFDFRVAVARRLTRALARKGQAEFASNIIPKVLFNDSDRDEGRAVIALEILRTDRASGVPAAIANELRDKLDAERNPKTGGGGIKGLPFPASAQTLCAAVGAEFKPPLVTLSPTGAADAPRLAYAGKFLLEDNPDEALRLATRGTSAEATSQLRALVLCAEWSPDPGPALDAALAIVNAGAKANPAVRYSQSAVLRLSQIAAAANKHEQAKALAESLTDDGLRSWAKADIIRHRVAANPREKADEAWAEEVPTLSEKLKVGHAWGRLWIARQNTRLSGDSKAEKKATAMWPTVVHPFALAGIALGLKDQ